MSLNRRFTWVLAGLLLGLVALWLQVTIRERRERVSAAEQLQQDRLSLLQHWLSADRATFLDATRALGGTEFATDAAPVRPDPWPPAWLFDQKGKLLRAIGTAGIPPELPWQDAAFQSWLRETDGVSFTLLAGGEAYEAAIVPFVASAEDTAPARLLCLRPWDDARLQTLGALAEATVRLELRPDAGRAIPRLPLTDWRGRPVAWLAADFAPPAQFFVADPRLAPTPWFIAFGLLVVGAVALTVRRWVLGPLDRISRSLATGDPGPVQPLLQDRGEMGALSRLVQTSFQREATLRLREAELQRSIDERIRLGRDLHDGIIQSLYATGMGLAGIKAQLLPAQSAVAEALEQSRSALNGTILDLRNFITGLEPESLQQQPFGEAVATLLENARQARPVQTECEVDNALAARLTIGQRAHILQITREAVSNALRHGAATAISVRLTAGAAGAVLEVSDNGRGFDPAAENGHGGHGLNNLTDRAAEIGAQLTLTSGPGQGTRLQLILQPRPAQNP